MGLILEKLKFIDATNAYLLLDRRRRPIASAASNNNNNSRCGKRTRRRQQQQRFHTVAANLNSNQKFPDLNQMPIELSLQILKYLDATDLCLAACVWSGLASDDSLWRALCKSNWAYVSAYNPNHQNYISRSYRNIFMLLDEATLTFNADWRKGIEYLFKHELVDNHPMELARFINSTKMLDLDQKEGLFKEMPDVLENVINLITYENQPLPTALRKFFSEIKAPNERNAYLSALLEKFSKRFCSCNPHLELSEDAVYILCFSLILLSVDLTSPAVRNKMSKREFIKNTRNALPNISIDYTGHLYDNIYLNGAIASSTSSPSSPWASDEENNNNNRVQQVIIH